MNKYYFIKENDLWSSYKLNQLAKSPTEYDDLETPLNNEWRKRARRLQVRRWRKIKQQLV